MTTMSCSAASRWLSPGSAPVAEQNAAQSLGRAAVRDNALDRRHGCANRADLGLGLPATADDAEAAGAGRREVLRGNATRGPGAPLAESVRLDHRCEGPGLQLKEGHDEFCISSAAA